ncbi:hypothetical protein [Pseudoxanthomonas suwonensis]|uniref:hypothetical protein n=1 Tax=Pseudoxanthomonas suwonensis TaxID=314722 RepID=UPI00046408EB|nr:hypothetical protein [Pseudoxanthomonas suwonensis]
MAAKSRDVLIPCFLVAFLAVGLPYWLTPLKQLALPDAILDARLVVVAVMAAVPAFLSGAGFWLSWLVIGASVPAAIFARVAYDVILDPGTHNLWPFEIALVLAPGFGSAFLGALVGGLPGRLLFVRKSA